MNRRWLPDLTRDPADQSAAARLLGVLGLMALLVVASVRW